MPSVVGGYLVDCPSSPHIMITIYSPHHHQHDPPYELTSGRLIPYSVAPHRTEDLVNAVRASG